MGKKLLSFFFSVIFLAAASLLFTFQSHAIDDSSPFAADAITAAAVPQGFQDSTVFSGLNNPMAVRFAPNGKVFIAEKSGIIKVFDNLTDTTPTIFANLSSQVNDYWDRGMMSLAVDPNFPTNPYIYVAYAYDAPPGQTAPYWNDSCADPNGAGCLITGRVTRLTANGNTMVAGSEKILISDWCQQFPSHSIGDLQFGSDGALLVTGGEGANFNYADHGQTGNPCGDPVNEGGALRSLDLMTTGDPLGLSGTLIRIDPATGNAFSGNPLLGGATNDDRILAYGLRNPFRFAIHPTSGEVWIGNVGWGRWEAIDRVQSPLSSVKNYGWPCYEGTDRTQGYSTLNLPLCQTLYSNGSVIPPYYQYIHQGSSAISALAFYNNGNYPSQYRNALFMADYAAGWLKVMFPNAAGLPDTNNILTFADSVYITDLQTGPNGDIFYVNIATGEVHRIQYFSTNTPPVAQVSSNRTNGPAPLTIQFNASTSYDPDLDPITFSWDFNGDGVYGESTSATPTHTYNAEGIYNASVRVTDSRGAFNNANLTISVGNAPVPRITLPSATETYQVGDSIKFAGEATDSNNNFLPASSLSWQSIIHHCAPSNPSDCHDHFLQSFEGVSAGTIVAPDHEYPSYLEFRLTAKQDGFPAGWWNTSWLNRKKLTFNTSGITSTLTNFPVLVTLTPANFDYSKSGTNGNSLRFIDKNNNVLAYEIEQWNQNGTSSIWVKVPSINATDNYMWMYYANPAAPAGQNRTAVWSDAFRGVWHLNNATSDSTANAFNGTSTNSTATTGKIAGGYGFNGTNARVAINHSSLLSFSSTQSFTMGAWVNYTTKSGTKGVITKSRNTSSWYGLMISTANRWQFGGPSSLNGPAVSSGWNYVQLVQDGPARRRTIYVNGTQVATGTSQSGTGTGQLWFGGSSGRSEWFQGTLDEISISGAARSAQWVTANYRSVNNNMVTFAAEEGTTTLSSTTSVSIQPQTTNMTFRTNPAGLNVAAYSVSRTAPFTIEAKVGAAVPVSAPAVQTVNGIEYTFQGWSDGGARDHFITAPVANTTYTANYAANVPEGTLIWNSFDITPSGLNSLATVNDTTGAVSATIEFYESINIGGIDKGTLFTQYTGGNHFEAHQKVNKFYSFESGGGHPYAGKSSVGRGSDTNETNTPFPLEVFDLQLHPPDNERLTVAEFRAPASGTYVISNLAVRRIDPMTDQLAAFSVYDNAKNLLVSMPATAPTAWNRNNQEFTLTLNQNDKLYFAVDPQGRNWWDSIEVNWTVTKKADETQPAPTINSFTANPTSIQTGQSSTLSWDVTDATTVTIDNGVGTVGAAGSASVSPTADTIYTLSATNSTGTVTRTADVTVTAVPPAQSLEWNSYDVTPTGLNSVATIADTTGTVSATIEFYESINIGGIDKGTLFTQYTTADHIETHQKVNNFYSFVAGGGHPYAGKSNVGRGSDTSETNAPTPLGVMDLQLHPPDNERLTVAEFSAPRTGTYIISNLGVRRVDPMTDQLAAYKVYDNSKTLLTTLASVPTAWVTSTQEYTVTLNQGDKIYFAIDPQGRNWWDMIEVIWKIRLQN